MSFATRPPKKRALVIAITGVLAGATPLIAKANCQISGTITSNTPEIEWASGNCTVASNVVISNNETATALLAVGTGLGTLTNNGTIAGTRYGFLNAASVGTLINNGRISALTVSAAAIYNNSAIGQLINNGTITSGSEALFNPGSIGTLTNNGLINGSGGYGYTPRAGVRNAGVLSVLDNEAGGTIIGGSSAVINSGQIGTLTNSGTINSTNAAGVGGISGPDRFGIYNATTGNIDTLTNNASGFISGGTAAIGNAGTIGTLTNAGTLSGTSDGLSNTGTLQSMSNSGLISGGQWGIVNAGDIVTLTNTGSITGATGGIDNTGTIGALINAGAIATAGADMTIGSGTVVSGSALTVTNTGIIGTAIDAGIYNDVAIAGIANSGTITAGGLSITGNGTVGAQYAAALYNDAGGTIGTLTNAGVIGGALPNFGIESSGSIGALTNSGSILGYREAILNAGSIGTLTNQSGGTIALASVGAQGSDIVNTGTIDVLSNSGVIGNGTTELYGVDNAAGGTLTQLNNEQGGTIYGYYTAIENAGTLGTLSNSGTIIGWTAAVDNKGTIGQLANTGAIRAILGGGSSGVGVNNNASGNIGTLTNNGLIYGSKSGVYNDGTIGTLSNTGTITGALYGIKNDTTGTITQLSNSGTISGAQFGIGNVGTIDNLLNSGEISSAGTAIGIANAGRIGLLNNAGVIAGNIVNQSTNDLSISGGTGSIFGTLTGFGNTVGTITNTTSNVVFVSGNQLLNDNVNVGSNAVNNTGATLQVNHVVAITGNYAQDANATLLVGVSDGAAASGSLTTDAGYGRLVVSGSATVASGSNVTLQKLNAYGFAAGQRFVVIDANTTGTNYNANQLVYSIAGGRVGSRSAAQPSQTVRRATWC